MCMAALKTIARIVCSHRDRELSRMCCELMKLHESDSRIRYSDQSSLRWYCEHTMSCIKLHGSRILLRVLSGCIFWLESRAILGCIFWLESRAILVCPSSSVSWSYDLLVLLWNLEPWQVLCFIEDDRHLGLCVWRSSLMILHVTFYHLNGPQSMNLTQYCNDSVYHYEWPTIRVLYSRGYLVEFSICVGFKFEFLDIVICRRDSEKRE